MKNLTKLIGLSMCLSLPLTSCDSASTQPLAQVETSEFHGAKIVAEVSTLPICDSTSLNQLFYVVELEAFKVCAAEGYIDIDLKGPAGPAGIPVDGTPGTPGATGAQGENGVDGVDGTNGIDGTNGVDGINGTNGANGTDGNDGVDGNDGADGTNGINGADGAIGNDGINGNDGTNGIDGTNGVDGINGTNGVDGTNGTNGVDGTNGTNGVDGTNGIDGTNGTNGIDGTNGTIGVDGTNGTNGVDGTNGTNGVDGAPGAKGDQGEQGLPGTPGGPKGETGAAGTDGTNGSNGIDGTNGTNGVDGTNGTNGVDGTNGTNGVDGTNGTNGVDGTNGTNGVDGNSFLSGLTIPDPSTGTDNDTYLDIEEQIFYTKTNGVWVIIDLQAAMAKVDLDYLLNAGVSVTDLFGTQYTLRKLIEAGIQEDSLHTVGILGSVEDTRDNTMYEWVTIGTQKWMRSNLDYASTIGSSCYDDDLNNCTTYGRLYDFKTAIDSATDLSQPIQGICPDAWHLPTNDEWTILNDYITDNFTVTAVGTSLLEANENQFGFDGFLGGYEREPGTPNAQWDQVDTRGRWWAAGETNDAVPAGNFRHIYLDWPVDAEKNILGENNHNQEYKMSVRCLLD